MAKRNNPFAMIILVLLPVLIIIPFLLMGKNINTHKVGIALIFFFVAIISLSSWKWLIIAFCLSSFLIDNPMFRNTVGFNIADKLRWLFFVFLFVHAVFKWLVSKGKTFFNIPEILFLIFSSQAFLSTIYSIRPKWSLLRGGELLMLWFIVFVFLKEEFREKPEEAENILYIPLIIWGFSIVGGIIMMLLGKWNIFLYGNPLRMRGLSYNPNQFGMTCILAVPSTMFLFMHKKKFFYNVLFISGLILTVMSGSRSAILSVFISVMVLIIYTGQLRRFLPVIMFFISISLASFVISKNISSLGETILKKESTARDFSESFHKSRLRLWVYGLEFFSHRPLMGHGYGTGPYVWLEYYEPEMFELNVTAKGGPYFENSYVEIIVSLGLVGFSLFISFLWGFFSLIRRNILHTQPTDRLHALSIAHLSLFSGCIVYSLFISWIFAVGNYNSLIFWSMMAASLSIHEKIFTTEQAG